MAPGFFLAVLLALPSAAEDYTVSFRLEDGLQEHRHSATIAPNAYLATTFVSTNEGIKDSFLFTITPFQSAHSKHVDLSYQFEWSRQKHETPVFVRQGMDWSRIPEDREIKLLEIARQWRLWVHLKSPEENSCLPPAKGGGLRVTAVTPHRDARQIITRRTTDGVTSVLDVKEGNYQPFHLQLIPLLKEDGKEANVDFEIGWNGISSTGTVVVTLGKMTEVFPELGIKIENLEPIPSQESKEFQFKKDPKTGWLRHSGKTISFSYPPEWNLSESCDKNLIPNGWNLTNRAGPNKPAQAIHLFGFTLSPTPEPLAEEGAAQLLDVDGGQCLVWRDEVTDPLCREKCEASMIGRAECKAVKAGGFHAAFNFDLGKESGLEVERFGKLLRFVKSFKF